MTNGVVQHIKVEESTSIQIGWSGGTMVLGKLLVPERPTNSILVGQGPTVLAVGAGGGCFDNCFSRLSFLFHLPLFGRRPDIDRNTVSKGR